MSVAERLPPAPLVRRISAERNGGSAEPPEDDGRGTDLWPRTHRLMPWLVAAFLVAVYLVPLDAVQFNVHLPFDSKFDRFALGFLVLCWIVSAFGRPEGRPRLERSPVNVAIFVFLCVCGASVALNLVDLAHSRDLELAVKKLSLLASYVMLYYVVVTVVRPAEVPAFVNLLVGLGVLVALGTIYEYRSEVNVFYDAARSLIPGATVLPPPPSPMYERPSIVGSTQHGLADCTLLAAALPFALMGLLRAATTRRKALWGIVIVLLVGGGIATLRKTAVIVPVTALVVMAAYRPRAVLRYWPLLIVMVVVVRALAPGAISGVTFQFTNIDQSASTAGRTADYAAVVPDVVLHPLLGRGFGSFDPQKYRILDNQLLGMVIEVGVAGLLAYIGIMLAAVLAVHRHTRERDPDRLGPGVAVVAVVAAFFVSNFLYDALSFRNAVYVFFFVVALGIALTRDDPRPPDVPAPG